MNEEFNPYDSQQAEERQPEQRQPDQPYDSYYQTQSDLQDHQPQIRYTPQQDYRQQDYYRRSDYYPQPDYYNQPDQYGYYPYQNQTYNQTYNQPNEGKAARIFSIISFVAGCFSMLRASLIVFELAMSGFMLRGIDLSISDVFSIMSVAVPGLVFGIIALIKKTKMIPMAMLGAIFNGTVIVTVLTLLFFCYSFG